MAKIIGGTACTPLKQSDWNQTDPNKADYIKNKPFETVDDELDVSSTNPLQNKVIHQVLNTVGNRIVAAEEIATAAQETATEAAQNANAAGHKAAMAHEKVENLIVPRIEIAEGTIADHEQRIRALDASVADLNDFQNSINDDVASNRNSILALKNSIEGTDGLADKVTNLIDTTNLIDADVADLTGRLDALENIEADTRLTSLEEWRDEMGDPQQPSTQTDLVIINARDFGAVGDGEIDDTEAIQKALYAAEAKKCPLYIPAGNYKVSKTITTHTRATEADIKKQSEYINIFGSGMSTTFTTTPDFEGEYVFIIEDAPAETGMLWLHGFNIVLNADVSGIFLPSIGAQGVVEDLWIYHNQQLERTTVRTGIYTEGATAATFQRIKVFGVYHPDNHDTHNPEIDGEACKYCKFTCGLTFGEDSNPVDGGHTVKILDCDIIWCNWAIYLAGGSHWVIDKCRIEQNRYGIYHDSRKSGPNDDRVYKFTQTFKNLTISDCRIEHNVKYGIYLSAYNVGYLRNENVVISGNYFTGLGSTNESVAGPRAMFFRRIGGLVIENNIFNGELDNKDKCQYIAVGVDYFGDSPPYYEGYEFWNVTLANNVVGTHRVRVKEGDNEKIYSVKGYVGLPDAMTENGFINNIEANQSSVKASNEVRGSYVRTITSGGVVDVSKGNLFRIDGAVTITGLTIDHAVTTHGLTLGNGDTLNGIILDNGDTLNGFTIDHIDANYSQEVTLVATMTDGTATIHHSEDGIHLAGGADFVMGKHDAITLVCVGDVWMEKCRSVHECGGGGSDATLNAALDAIIAIQESLIGGEA